MKIFLSILSMSSHGQDTSGAFIIEFLNSLTKTLIFFIDNNGRPKKKRSFVNFFRRFFPSVTHQYVKYNRKMSLTKTRWETQNMRENWHGNSFFAPWTRQSAQTFKFFFVLLSRVRGNGTSKKGCSGDSRANTRVIKREKSLISRS